MTDRPIIMHGSSVRGILAGTKTMTRRVLARSDGEKIPRPASYCVGDRLWVRETLQVDWMTNFLTGERDTNAAVPYYEADDTEALYPDGFNPAWIWKRGKLAAMHMPRTLSRLTLIVTEVKVERVQSISREDALAEGIVQSDPTPDDEEWNRNWCAEHGHDYYPLEPVWLAPGTRQGFGARPNAPKWGPTPEFAFRLLWEHLNGKRPGCSWADNPWVVAVRFETHRQNIDQVRA